MGFIVNTALSLFSGYKNWIIGIVIAAVVAFAIGWYYTITSELEDLKEENSNLKVENLLQKNNVIKLQAAINESNAALEKIKVDNAKTLADFEEWKKKPAKTKYVEVVKEIVVKDYSNATCKEGLELNKKISELNYDDL